MCKELIEAVANIAAAYEQYVNTDNADLSWLSFEIGRASGVAMREDKETFMTEANAARERLGAS